MSSRRKKLGIEVSADEVMATLNDEPTQVPAVALSRIGIIDLEHRASTARAFP